MKKFSSLMLILFVAMLGGCATVSTSADWDTSANLDALRTYAWVPGPQERSGDPRVDNTLIDSRIRQATDAAFAEKGYRKVGVSSADFLVQYHAAIEGKIDVTTIDTPYYGTPYYVGGIRGGGYSGWDSFGGSQTFVTQYDEGTVLLDIVDSGTKELVWRGTGSATVNPDAKPEKRKKRINEGMRKILAQFPPQEK